MGAARTHEVRGDMLAQQTPAPLLVTNKGQLPYLPVPLARLATPRGTTRLHSLPAPEWHVLNANTGLRATHLLPQLSLNAKSASCSHDCILFLTMRAVPSYDLLTDAPGKRDAVCSFVDGSRRTVMSPDDMCELHAAMRTDFCVSLSDGMTLHCAPKAAVLQRRARRNEKLQHAFLLATEQRNTNGVLLSIQGADCVSSRAHLATAAATAAAAHSSRGAVRGFAIEGLYAGESTEARFECVTACVEAVAHTALLRVLLGGSGAPHEVLRAVDAGVDVVEACYPFEMAENGLALRLTDAQPPISLLARSLTLSTEPLAARCACGACGGDDHHGNPQPRFFSRGYIHHLLEVHEMMGVSLLAVHNVWQYLHWFEELRSALSAGRLAQFAESYAAAAISTSSANPALAAPTVSPDE